MAAAVKYPVELKERAVALVRERQREGRGRGAIAQVARDLGVHPEALRHWLGQEDAGRRPSGEVAAGSVLEKDTRIKELERRVGERERANPGFSRGPVVGRRGWTQKVLLAWVDAGCLGPYLIQCKEHFLRER